jgi:hypothetical protein
MGIGGGKSSGSQTTQVQLTPEQRETLAIQNEALKNTFLPAYKNTVGGAQNVYSQVNPAAATAAQTAMDVGQRAGALQEAGGTEAYQQGLGGSSQLAGFQTNLGKGLAGGGAGGLSNAAQTMTGAGQQAYGAGAGGVGNIAEQQAGIGSALTGAGASQLSQLFSPEYKQQQVNAALQPATEDIREQMNQQGSLFGGAGGLGSARQALASRNLASLGQARLGNIAAQTSAGVESQRQQAANTLLGTGQAAAGTAGSLYSGLLGQGAGLMGQGANAYQGLLGAGQAALGAGQTGYGNLANLGQTGLSAAQQAAASRIGYAQTPQDIFSKYASVVFGVPQASTTPNYAGTQGSTGTTSGTGKSGGLRL